MGNVLSIGWNFLGAGLISDRLSGLIYNLFTDDNDKQYTSLDVKFSDMSENDYRTFRLNLHKIAIAHSTCNIEVAYGPGVKTISLSDIKFCIPGAHHIYMKPIMSTTTNITGFRFTTNVGDIEQTNANLKKIWAYLKSDIRFENNNICIGDKIIGQVEECKSKSSYFKKIGKYLKIGVLFTATLAISNIIPVAIAPIVASTVIITAAAAVSKYIITKCMNWLNWW
jgi:hypothetical protein